MPDEEMLDLNLWQSDHFLPWIQEGKFFYAKFEYEGDQLPNYYVTSMLDNPTVI